MQLARRVGIDEVVKHVDGGDLVANKDPELRIWDALETGTHDDTMRDAMAEHLQARVWAARSVHPVLTAAASVP